MDRPLALALASHGKYADVNTLYASDDDRNASATSPSLLLLHLLHPLGAHSGESRPVDNLHKTSVPELPSCKKLRFHCYSSSSGAAHAARFPLAWSRARNSLGVEAGSRYICNPLSVCGLAIVAAEALTCVLRRPVPAFSPHRLASPSYNPGSLLRFKASSVRVKSRLRFYKSRYGTAGLGGIRSAYPSDPLHELNRRSASVHVSRVQILRKSIGRPLKAQTTRTRLHYSARLLRIRLTTSQIETRRRARGHESPITNLRAFGTTAALMQPDARVILAFAPQSEFTPFGYALPWRTSLCSANVELAIASLRPGLSVPSAQTSSDSMARAVRCAPAALGFHDAIWLSPGSVEARMSLRPPSLPPHPRLLSTPAAFEPGSALPPPPLSRRCYLATALRISFVSTFQLGAQPSTRVARLPVVAHSRGSIALQASDFRSAHALFASLYAIRLCIPASGPFTSLTASRRSLQGLNVEFRGLRLHDSASLALGAAMLERVDTRIPALRGRPESRSAAHECANSSERRAPAYDACDDLVNASLRPETGFLRASATWLLPSTTFCERGTREREAPFNEKTIRSQHKKRPNYCSDPLDSKTGIDPAACLCAALRSRMDVELAPANLRPAVEAAKVWVGPHCRASVHDIRTTRGTIWLTLTAAPPTRVNACGAL
ncbi:hypothetical protein B0H14DRAFT_3426916 [Mycena olivaceomarginata]|nr:hypothetical protein B0H14DRAFT_3426916 [Mycena olivaceomarginata]